MSIEKYYTFAYPFNPHQPNAVTQNMIIISLWTILSIISVLLSFGMISIRNGHCFTFGFSNDDEELNGTLNQIGIYAALFIFFVCVLMVVIAIF